MATIQRKMSRTSIIIGSRGSKLALTQSELVKQHLIQKYPDTFVEIKIIKTSGDLDLSKPISELGGKGVFIKEIEQALLDKVIDVAVHSFKDITTHMHQDLELILYRLCRIN